MHNKILTEKDLEAVFSGKKTARKKIVFINRLKPIGVFIILTVVVYVGFNFNGLKQNLLYWYNETYHSDPQSNIDNLTAMEKFILSQNQSSRQLPPLPQIENNSIKISAISTTAPITWNVENTPEKVTENLKKGVIHVKGTALPGEIGNVFITGHSSNYPWIKSQYNSIFALLNKIVVGDIIHLKYNEQDYLYKVSDIKVVKPDDTSVMQQGNDSILTLMTCTPVGTSLKRLIITSKQIYPNPSGNVQKNSSNTNLELPKKIR